MSARLEHLERLADLCSEWGGSLALVSEHTFNRVFYTTPAAVGPDGWPFVEAPFADWAGMHWDAKLIVGVHDRVNVNAVIHEMGHVFACKTDPNGVKWDGSYEWDFLGWEMAVAYKVGCYQQWSDQNSAYGVDDGSNWGDLSLDARAAMIKERMEAAATAGLLDANGHPLAIR